MAFPQIVASNGSGEESDVTTHNVSLPTTVNTGELLLIYASINDPRTFTAPSGWTLIRELSFDLNAGAVFGKVAAGTEGGTIVDFTTSGTTRSAHVSLSVSGWGGNITDVEVSTGNGQGSTFTHDPDQVTASWGGDDNLFIASTHVRKGGSRIVTEWPVGYNNNRLSYVTAANSGGALMAIASREFSSTNDNPSTFRTDVDVTNSVSFTTVIKSKSSALARWLLDEDSSGTSPTTIVDDTGNGTDLSIVYSNDANWSTIESGNGLNFDGPAGSDTGAVASLSDISTNGVLGSALDGVSKMAMLFRIDARSGNGSFIGSRFFHLGQSSDSADVACVVLTDGKLRVLWDYVNTFGTVDFPIVTGGIKTVYIEVDTTQGVQADRCRVWYDNVEQTVDSGGFGTNSLTGINNTDRFAAIGNSANGNRNFDGIVYYAEIFSNFLTEQERTDAHNALSLNNDSDWRNYKVQGKPAPSRYKLDTTNPLTSGLVSANFMLSGSGVPKDLARASTQLEEGSPKWTTRDGEYVYEFDADGDSLVIGKGADLDNLGAMTLIVKRTSLAEHVLQNLFDKSNNDSSGPRWRLNNGGQEFRIDYNTADYRRYTGSVAINVGDTNTFAVTWDGTALATGTKHYRDGVELTNIIESVDGGGVRLDDSGNDWRLSARADGARAIDGEIHYALIFNRALTAQEITDITNDPYSLIEADNTPVTVVNENFTAANESSITTLDNGWDNAANCKVYDYSVVSNSQFSGFLGSRPTTGPKSADQRVKFTVTAASQRPMAVALRLSDDDQYGYYVQPAGGNLELKKIVAGTRTLITSATLDTTLPTVIEFSVIGNKLKVIADGVQIISETDTEVLLANSWGIGNHFSPANNTNLVDSLVFEDVLTDTNYGRELVKSSELFLNYNNPDDRIRDLSDYDATLVNTGVQFGSTELGEAVAIHSGADELDFTSEVARFAALDEFSASVDFRTTTLSGVHALIAFSDTSAGSTDCILYQEDTNLRFQIREAGAFKFRYSINGFLELDRNYNVCVSTGSEGPKLWIDGVFYDPATYVDSGSATSTDSLSSIPINSSKVGRNTDSSGDEFPFAGSMDNVLIHASQFTQADVDKIVAGALKFQSQDIYINFYDNSQTAPAPWSYNAIGNAAVSGGIASSDLKDSNNKSTGLTLEVINPFTDSTGGTTTADTGVGEWPQEVFDYFWYNGSSENPATLRFGGFGAGDTYRLELAGHSTSAVRDTTYSIIEGNSAVYDNSGTGNPYAPIVLTGTIVNSSFDLDVSLINTFGYISGAKLIVTRGVSNVTGPRKQIVNNSIFEESENQKLIVGNHIYESSTIPEEAVDVTGTIVETLEDTTMTASGTVSGVNVTGSLSETLEDVTSASSGTITISGSLSETLDNVTSNSSGTITISGSLSETLDNVTSTSSGTITVSGSLSETLENVTSNSSGQVGSNVTGSLSETLDSVTMTASGTFTIEGTLNEVLDNVTSVSTGTLRFTGTISETLDDFTMTSTGDVKVTGVISEILEDVTMVATGFAAGNPTGVVNEVLDDVTMVSSGSIPIVGTIIETLSDTLSNSSGIITVTGVINETLEGAVSSSSGDLSLSGSLNEQLEDVVITASGIVFDPVISGSLSEILEDVNAISNGNVIITGSLNELLDDVTMFSTSSELITTYISYTYVWDLKLDFTYNESDNILKYVKILPNES